MPGPDSISDNPLPVDPSFAFLQTSLLPLGCVSSLYRLDIPARLEVTAEKSGFLYRWLPIATLSQPRWKVRGQGVPDDRMSPIPTSSRRSASLFFDDRQHLHP